MSNLVVCEGCGRECNPDQEWLSRIEVNVLNGTKREITLCDKVCCEFWDEAGPSGWVKLDSGEHVQRIFWQCDICEGVYRHAVLVMLVDMDDYDPEEGKEPCESVVCFTCRGKEPQRFKTRAEVESKAEGAKPLSAEERLVENLKDIRFDLLTVGEKLRDPMAALDALKTAQAKVTKLIQDASRPK